MNTSSYMVRSGFYSVLAALGMITCLHLCAPAVLAEPSIRLANKRSRQQTTSEKLRYKAKPTKLGDFSQTGAPRNRGSAGSRGNCPASTAEQQPVQALVPLSRHTAGDGSTLAIPLGTTLSSHPSFWFQMPYTSAQVEHIDFTLVNETSQQLVHEFRVAPATSLQPSGLWRIQWPSSAVALNPNQTYRWYFVVACSEDGAGLLISGLIQRQSLPAALSKQLQQASEHDRMFLYADHGIWHETLTLLNEMYPDGADSSVWRSQLNSLLESAGIS